MEAIKVLVKKIENPSGMVSLAAKAETVLTEKITLKEDQVFFSITPLTWKKMKRPSAVLVTVLNGNLYIEPVF